MRETPPIRCTDLAVGYNGEAVLEQLSVTVASGETLALVGQSGCGKTTLVRTLAGSLPPLAGEARVLGVELPASPPPGDVGYIPQDLGLVRHGSVRRNVLHGTLSTLGPLRSLLGRFPPAAHEAAEAVIDQVGLGGLADRPVSVLSGGQARRVAIARALVQRPRVLLADEILSELDIDTARTIISCVESLQATTDTTVVIVEHDLAVADELADRLLRLDGDTAVSPATATEGTNNA